jgi:hypothetical protein
MPLAPGAPTAAREPPAAHVPSVAHAPALPHAPMASATMTDLWAKLNHYRGGKDNHVTIECQHERRRNNKGHKLEGEFDSLAPAREAHIAHATRPLGFWEDAWRSLRISIWWSGCTSSSPTYQRSTTGLSTPPNFYRSTPPLSSQQEVTRSSRPTTSLWP